MRKQAQVSVGRNVEELKGLQGTWRGCPYSETRSEKRELWGDNISGKKGTRATQERGSGPSGVSRSREQEKLWLPFFTPGF